MRTDTDRQEESCPYGKGVIVGLKTPQKPRNAGVARPYAKKGEAGVVAKTVGCSD